MKLGNSLGNRIMALVLCVIMVLGMIPANAIALEGDTALLGAVVKLTPNGEEVEPAEIAEETTVLFSGEFTKVQADESIGRNQDGWWAGIRVKAPAGIKLADAKYKRTKADEWSDFSEKAVADNYVDLWCLISEDLLENAIDQNKDITYSWNFDWNIDGESDQTVVLKVLAGKVVLLDLDGEKTVYPICGAATKLTPDGQEIEPVDAAKKITMTFSGELQKVPADESIGRNQDGWWVGVRVKAPAGLDRTQAQYKRTKATEWTKLTETQKADGYVDLWCLVDESVLGYAKEDGMIRYSWEFDWDGNGLYAQDVVVEINANEIVLKDGETTTYPQYGSAVKLTPNGEEVDPVQFGQSIAMVFDKEELVKVDADTTIGRDNEGWWVGVRVKAPENAVLANAKYKRRNAETWEVFNTNNQGYVDLWCLVTPELLSKAKDNGKISYSWVFAWFGENADKQNVVVQIDATQIVLKNQDGSMVYPVYGAATELNAQGKEINANEAAAELTVNYKGEDGKLDKMPIDETIGRTEEGWWAGIRVKAPEGVDLEKAVYKRTKATEWKNLTETQKADGYVDLWCMVKPEYFVDDEGNAKDSIQYNWDFAWFGANAYTQKVVLNISANAVELYDGETMVYPYPATISNIQAYVDSNGQTQVIFDYEARHGIESFVVDGIVQENAPNEKEAYQVPLEGAKKTVIIRLADKFGYVAEEEVNVQQQLGVTLKASEAVNKVNSTYYYNADNKLAFTVQVENFDHDKYAVNKATLTIDKTAYQVELDENGKGTFTCDSDIALSDIQVAVEDATGRKASASLDGTYVYDTVAPDIQISLDQDCVNTYNGTDYYNKELNVTIKVSDANLTIPVEGEQVQKLDLKVNGELMNSLWSEQEQAYIAIVPVKDGQPLNELSVEVVDKAKNPSTDSYKGNPIVVDTQAPKAVIKVEGDENNQVVGFYKNAAGKWYVKLENPVKGDSGSEVKSENVEITLTVTVTDANLALDAEDGYCIKNNLTNNKNWVKQADGSYIYTAKLTVGPDQVVTEAFNLTVKDLAGFSAAFEVESLGEGRSTFTPKVNDGNIEDEIGVDRRRPSSGTLEELPIIIVEANKESTKAANDVELYNGAVEFSFTLTDADGDIAEKTAQVKDPNGIVSGSGIEKGNGKYIVPVILNKSGETNDAQLTITVEDLAGNQIVYVKKFAVDTQAPRISVEKNRNSVNTVQNTNIHKVDTTYTITVEDINLTGFGLTYYLNGERFNITQEDLDSNHQYKINLINGDVLSSMTLSAVDAAGNETKAINTDDKELSFEFKESYNQYTGNVVAVDTEAPVIKVSKTNKGKKVQTATIDGNMVDFYDGEVIYTIRVEDEFLVNEKNAVAKITYTLDGQQDAKIVNLFENPVGDPTIQSGALDIYEARVELPDGAVLTGISAEVKDHAGFESQKGNSVKLAIDMTPPTVEVTKVSVESGNEHYVQTAKSGEKQADYYNGNVTYKVTVKDQFLDVSDKAQVSAKITLEGSEATEILALMPSDSSAEIADMDIWSGEFTLVNGQVLTDIQIIVLDNAKHEAETVKVTETKGTTAFEDQSDLNGAWTYTGNYAIVDTVAPMVKVETVANDPIRSVDGVDYFDSAVEYIITVEDQFLDSAEGATIYAEAIFENEKDTKKVTLNCATDAGKLADIDTWSGKFSVENGQVLKEIQLTVLDKAEHEAEQVDVSETAGNVAFDDLNDNSGAWKYSGNYTVVDMTAPEVTVVTNTKDYIQTVDGVDYFDNEVEYQFVVTDQFMEEGTYDLEVKAFFEGDDEPVILEWERFDENEEQDLVGGLDTFISSFKVIDGQVLQNIEILVKDAVTGKPEEIKTINLYNETESNSDCTLSFAERVVDELPTGIFECTSNDVVVDMTAPEITVDKIVNGEYIQTLKDGEVGYDYYNGEVTYIITVIDNFLTKLNKQADKSVIEVEYIVDGVTHTVAMQEPTEPTEPEITEPEITEPVISEPETTGPETSEPETTEPEATEVTEPEVTEPEETEPEATEMLQEEDIYEGRITVIDGQTLSAITIKVIDDAGKVAKIVEVSDEDTEIDLTTQADSAVGEGTTEENGNLLTNFAYKNGANVYVGNNVIVDTTAPKVTLSFSENVVGYHSRNEDVVYVQLKNPGEADSGMLTGQEKETVTVTVAVEDKNILLNPNNQYGLKNNLTEEPYGESYGWKGNVGKNTDSKVTYEKSIEVASDATGFFAIDLSVFDLASNPVELVMDNLNTTNGYIPQIQPVENGKIDATITVDRIRPGSEYEQQEDRNRPVITIESSIDPITILEDDIELYNDQLTFDLSVVDGDVNDDKNIYKNSGLQKVWWEITDEKGVVQTGVVNDTELEKGLYSVDYTIDIIIKDVIGETNSITLKIWAKDHVGNTTLYIDKFAVDNQAPRINVVYDNNSVQNEKYFKEDRIATVTVTDINFNGGNMENGTGTTISVNGQTYEVKAWNPVESGYQGVVRYDEDGDYEFSMITTDLARNTTTTSKDDSSEPDGYVTFPQDTAAPHVFTVDKTAPIIDVDYTPEVPNGTDSATGIEYFAQEREIRATITEVNFRASDVEADLGENNSLEWFSNGSTHVATDTFTEGNGYKVTIDYTDLAGNKAEKAHESAVFSVDKTKPTITISSGQMEVNKLNVVEDKLELGFQIHDEQSNLNLSAYTVKLFFLDKSLKKTEITDLNNYLTISDAGDNTDVYINFIDLPMEKRYDGIYTVQITAADFAQNAADAMELIYSVNRFGSTFYVEDEKTATFLTEDASGGIYHDMVEHSLKITEINPNKVWANAEHSYSGAAITLSVNGTSRVLEAGKDYTVKESNEQNANSDWYVYEYEIFKENFYNGDKPKDGNYDILFYSEDQANNKNTNEANEGSAIRTDANGQASGKMSFVLDSQKPIVTIIGLEKTSVQARNHIVKISVTDSTYVSVEVYVGNKLISLSDSEGTQDNSKNWLIRNADGSYSLNLISSQRREDVRVVIRDAAGNVQETTVKDVIVNDDIIILFVTNTPLLLGSIIGLIALIIVIILLIKRKKKKEA